LTWKEGFSEHKSMYQKRKTASTPHVNMEDNSLTLVGSGVTNSIGAALPL
jgi:hypothetical protein